MHYSRLVWSQWKAAGPPGVRAVGHGKADSEALGTVNPGDGTTASDSLNISERARWAACLLGLTRGHGSRDINSGLNISKVSVTPRQGSNHDIESGWPGATMSMNLGA